MAQFIPFFQDVIQSLDFIILCDWVQKKVVQDHKIKVNDRLYLLLILLEFDFSGRGKLTYEFIAMIVTYTILPACFGTKRSREIGLSAIRSPEDTKVHAFPYKIQRRKRMDDIQRLVLALFGINTLVKTAVTSSSGHEKSTCPQGADACLHSFLLFVMINQERFDNSF